MIDVLVIGAGVVGSATTFVYQTEGAGRVVNVSERSDQADTATVANGCYVAARFRPPTFWAVARQALLGNMRFEHLPCAPRRPSPSGRSAFSALCADGARSLDRFLAARAVPRFPYAGGRDGDGFFVDGHEVNALLKDAAEEAGAEFVEDTVVGAETEGGRITRVLGKRGSYETRSVVVCAGWRTGDVTKRLGAHVPVVALTGYSVTAEHRAARPSGFADNAALLTFFDGPRYARVAGKYDVVGAEPSARTRSLRFAEMEAVLRAKFGLAAAAPVRRWVGHRPVAPDGLPVMGPLPGLSNAWVNGAHGAVGLTCCLSSAYALFAGNAPPAFAPSRFLR